MFRERESGEGEREGGERGVREIRGGEGGTGRESYSVMVYN